MEEPLLEEPLEGSFHETVTAAGPSTAEHSTVPGASAAGHRFQCNACGNSYKSRDSLVKHFKKHTKDFVCLSCTQAFNNEDELTKHKATKHSLLFLCPHCGKTLNGKQSLKKHILLHEGKPHVCPYQACGKSFLTPKQLTDHINVHAGLKPYSCENCEMKFARKQSLSKHKMTCGRGVECPECQRVFSSASSLQDHKQTEHASMPFICECGKQFKWRPSLARHKKNCNDTA